MSLRGLPALQKEWRLTHLGVDNLRALSMAAPTELRRLVLLVGRNGVGKSTFARVFPLLRQSTGRARTEPLLWWHEDGVDFGTFAEAVREGQSQIGLTFHFSGATPSPADFSIDLRMGADDKRAAVRQVQVSEGGLSLLFRCGSDGKVKGELLRGGSEFQVDHPPLLPEMAVDSGRLFGIPGGLDVPDSLLDETKNLFHLNTSWDRRIAVLENLPWESAEALLNFLREQPFGKAYQKRLRALGDNPWLVEHLRLKRYAWHALKRAQLAESLMENLGERTGYLGPFRAIPARTYRPQATAVESLDSRGANLTMFLVALRPDERNRLDTFLDASFGFRVAAELDGGSYRLVVHQDNRRYNLLDMGFGYSQVLPLLVQLWAAGQDLSSRRRSGSMAALVIEQPELHLHPHHQCLVARALAQSAQADRGPMLIVETHSDHLIGEIGLQVAEGAVDAERVVVLCAEPDAAGSCTTLRRATFDESGRLQGWPAGFLSP